MIRGCVDGGIDSEFGGGKLVLPLLVVLLDERTDDVEDRFVGDFAAAVGLGMIRRG